MVLSLRGSSSVLWDGCTGRSVCAGDFQDTILQLESRLWSIQQLGKTYLHQNGIIFFLNNTFAWRPPSPPLYHPLNPLSPPFPHLTLYISLEHELKVKQEPDCIEVGQLVDELIQALSQPSFDGINPGSPGFHVVTSSLIQYRFLALTQVCVMRTLRHCSTHHVPFSTSQSPVPTHHSPLTIHSLLALATHSRTTHYSHKLLTSSYYFLALVLFCLNYFGIFNSSRSFSLPFIALTRTL